MELQELLEMLELDEPGDFEYFENFADLVECDEEIPAETMYSFFSQTDPDTVAELIQSYFEEILESVPNQETEVYMLLDHICRALVGMIRSRDENAMMHFAEEMEKFKNWYAFESAVSCRSLTDEEEKILPVRDALTLARLEKLQDEEYEYDFQDALDYELEDYIMSFADLADLRDDGEASENLLDHGYVYDDEMKQS